VTETERDRLDDPSGAWRRWGPYLSERAWGTVREDYSATGEAWDYLPHDHARSRAYRWSEDGLGGICDDHQVLCLAFAFWNGADPILKERIFGLTGSEGNHGEDAKEYWWYLDSTPTHSWMRWRYLYPQRAYPYDELVAENHRRTKLDPEYELLDTGVLDGGRYFDIVADYAKAGPEDCCIRLRVRNAGPDPAPIHVLPTLWFRNNWSWGYGDPRPEIAASGSVVSASHVLLGSWQLAGDGSPVPLVCDNDTNERRLFGYAGAPYPKDGIADHVLHGTPTVNPTGRGTKAALWYRLQVPAGGTAEVRLRLARPPAADAAASAGLHGAAAAAAGGAAATATAPAAAGGAAAAATADAGGGAGAVAAAVAASAASAATFALASVCDPVAAAGAGLGSIDGQPVAVASPPIAVPPPAAAPPPPGTLPVPGVPRPPLDGAPAVAADSPSLDLGASFERCLAERETEADDFYAGVLPEHLSAERAMIARQAFGGMLWCKQLYHYNVAHWLDGDPGQPLPPAQRKTGRNAAWGHLNTLDVMSMPDGWEYPWFAAWDLAFHCITLAHVDAAFAKDQLELLARVWLMHPNGQLPAYEWAFGDVNPPVHAFAALKVFEIDGSRDYPFLEAMFVKLLMNFTWWVNRKDAAGNNVFEGGFLGLDNIGPLDRSAQLPCDGVLEQSDGTSWMAMFCLNMWEIALILAANDPVYEDMAMKFSEHFTYIAKAVYDQGLWNEQDGFYYDVLALDSGERVPIRVHSLVGLIPLAATTTLSTTTLDRLPWFAAHFRWFLSHQPELAIFVGRTNQIGDGTGRLFSIVDPDRLERLLTRMLDENEFLSPHGLRSVSLIHRDHPFRIEVAGIDASVDYEPGESTSGLFGGNSNWRGPIWFPINYLLVESLRRFHRYLGDDFTVEMPTGSGRRCNLREVAAALADRLIGIFCDDEHGRRPVFGPYELFQTDPSLHDSLLFHEYFHGDDGHGIGASHQTGWTGLVANLIIEP